MKVRVGIVGLPNVGKSTLFNALAQKSIAQAENFPFCTIEPNTAPIAVPDPYLHALGDMAGSVKTIPATMDFVDVAGLVAGASRGEGLGNRFLATVRECNAICHVVRCFEDTNIVHVNGRVDPVSDAEVVNLELVLADISHVERRLEKTTCTDTERDTLENLLPELRKGVPARSVGLDEGSLFSIKSMGLLTLKPIVYAFNVDEVDFLFDHDEAMAHAEKYFNSIQYCDPSRDMFTLVSSKLEAEISARDKDEQLDYINSLGMDLKDIYWIDETMSYNILPNLVQKLLDLFLVYTGPGVPPERSRTTKAYLIPRAEARTAAQMAGRLHGEIQLGFIRAEVIPASVLLEYPNYNAAKEAGQIRTEGKDYIVDSGDVNLIKWK